YTKVDVNDPAYTSLYPINQTESIYVLNKDADVHAYEKAYLMTSFTENTDMLKKIGIGSSDELYTMMDHS
ncbi:hypothetical protein RFY99_11250, partial [Acinetobacter baumannii]|nr:hypothetical protein [Acinetobacter baumannii]